jgi:Ca2+-transporting ATPase
LPRPLDELGDLGLDVRPGVVRAEGEDRPSDLANRCVEIVNGGGRPLGAGGAAEMSLMLLGPFVGLMAPPLAAQILWINLLTRGLTGVAIGAEPVDPRLMEQPPRFPDQSILGAGLWQRVLLTGAVLTMTTLGLAVWAHDAGRPWQTMLFVGLTSAQLGVALGLGIANSSIANPLLPEAVTRSLVLVIAGLPLLQTLLGTVALGVPTSSRH